jgi:hypothetical protein
MKYAFRRLVWFIVLILGNIIWITAVVHGSDGYKIPEGVHEVHKSGTRILVYVAPDENPENCVKDRGRELGEVLIHVSSSNVVSGYREKGKILVDPNSVHGGMFYASSHGFMRDLAAKWWKLHLTDTKRSYCGVVKPGEVWWFLDEKDEHGFIYGSADEPVISDADMQKLRGVIITDWPAQLKLTVTGPNVKVEPLEACCSPEGKCVKQVLWQIPTLCPEGTSPAGKASNCHRCLSAKEFPVPTPIDKPPDGEQEENRGCCLPGGKCFPLSPQQCGMNCGVVLPLGQQCSGDDEADCADLLGACMVGEKCEPMQTKCSCNTVLHGDFLDSGYKCPPPEPEKGACCDQVENEWGEGGCSIETEKSCADRKEKDKTTFFPGAKKCEPNPCPKPEPKGGCCDGFGTCIDGVLEANCPKEEGKTFFPGGCPETCPIVVQGACYMPCPTSTDKEDCRVMSEKECASISNSRFELNKKCVETGCLNCNPCKVASGTWFLNLPDEHATLILNNDCTSRMIIKKQSNENTDGLPITHPSQREMDGFWGCSDQTIRISWAEAGEIVLIMAWEGGTLKLCYPDGDKIICAERNRTDAGMGVRHEKSIHGTKP